MKTNLYLLRKVFKSPKLEVATVISLPFFYFECTSGIIIDHPSENWLVE